MKPANKTEGVVDSGAGSRDDPLGRETKPRGGRATGVSDAAGERPLLPGRGRLRARARYASVCGSRGVQSQQQ